MTHGHSYCNVAYVLRGIDHTMKDIVRLSILDVKITKQIFYCIKYKLFTNTLFFAQLHQFLLKQCILTHPVKVFFPTKD